MVTACVGLLVYMCKPDVIILVVVVVVAVVVVVIIIIIVSFRMALLKA